MNQVIKVLPSQLKVDVQKIFNICEDNWGSENLRALVAFGSAARPPQYEEEMVTCGFLFFKWQERRSIRIYPNDLDVAAIYDGSAMLAERNIEKVARYREQIEAPYSRYWADMDRFAGLHLMKVGYKDLIAHKEQTDFRAVLDEGIVLWGYLPRPMRHAASA